VIRDAVVELPAANRVANNEVMLREEDLQVGTVTLARPPESVSLTHDIVVDVNTVIEGQTVGGFSLLLARSNVPPPRPIEPGPIRIVSEQIAQATPPAEPAPRTFELTAVMAPDAAHRLVLEYLGAQNIRIAQNDPARGLVDAKPIELSHAALLEATTPHGRMLIPNNAEGRYYLTIKTTPGEPGGPVETSHVEVWVRIFAPAGDDDDSPTLVPSNATIEQSRIGLYALI
jgi:hypothetical protein